MANPFGGSSSTFSSKVLASPATQRLLYPFARRFIAGHDRETAMKNVKRLYDEGFQCTIDVLGESVKSKEQAKREAEHYQHLLRDINAQMKGKKVDISLKLTALGMHIDDKIVRENLRSIVDEATTQTVRIDMESSADTDATLDIFQSFSRVNKNVGLCLQAYLKRTAADVDKLMQKGLSIRLVKGAYSESPSIAYTSEEDIRDNYMAQARKLMKSGYLPAFATHDEVLIRRLIAEAEELKVPKDKFYFELLYGVRRDLQLELMKRGYLVRIYVPYGKQWLPYTMRRLGEKRNMKFVLKSMAKEMFGLGGL